MSFFIYFGRNITQCTSIEASDVSICVFSLDEVIPRTSKGDIEVTIPDDVVGHLKPDTLFIFNKSDLARTHVPPHSLRKALDDALSRQASETRHFWNISLRSGDGTREFLDGLASVLKERYA